MNTLKRLNAFLKCEEFPQSGRDFLPYLKIQLSLAFSVDDKRNLSF